MSHSSESEQPPPTRRPFRITFCITELDPGGAERQLVSLATHLDRSLFEPEVVSLSGEGELAGALRAAGIPVTCLHAAGRWDGRLLFRLQRHLRGRRPDLVQTFLFHANIAGRLAARFASVPRVVCGIRVAERDRRARLWLDRATDRLVDRHVCVSRDVATFSQREGGLPARKLLVIPNAVDLERVAAAMPADLAGFGIAPGDPVVLFVGRMAEQKDPFRLLLAFDDIVSEFPRARLLFVGGGPLEAEVRREASLRGDRVLWLGPRPDVIPLMKSATCLALPSRWEGMPNVVLEAMAAGLPVVATDVEGVREALGDGIAGTIVDGNLPADFAAALRDVLGQPLRARAKARVAQDIVVQQHMVSGMVAAYQRLYLELLTDVQDAVAWEGFRSGNHA